MAKYLKLFMVALFAALTFTITSCGDDDDEPSVGNIVGTWKNSGGASLDFGIISYIQFSTDGKYVEVDIDEDEIDVIKGTWKLDGNHLNMITYNDFDMEIPSTHTIKKLTDKELIVISFGFEQTYKKVADSEIDKYLK